jgi:hypothetical protein
MALRISAKRVAVTLKARNGSIVEKVISRGLASQATAAVTNLTEEARNDIYVRALSKYRTTS